MIGNIMEWWSNFRKQRRLDKFDGLMDMSDVKLGRKTRRYFYRHDNMIRLNKCLVVALPELAILIALATMFNMTTSMTGILFTIILFLLLFAGTYYLISIMEYYLNDRTMYRSFNRGDIGKVMKPFIEWDDLHDLLSQCSFDEPYTPGLILFWHLLDLPFVNHKALDDMKEFDDIDDWTDEELGQFMKLMIGCIAIYVKGDGKPSRKALDKFIDESNARSIASDILNRIAVRKHKESVRRNRKEESESISLAESMKNKIVHEQPDKDNPDYARILNLKKKLDEKADELRLEAQP